MKIQTCWPEGFDQNYRPVVALLQKTCCYYHQSTPKESKFARTHSRRCILTWKISEKDLCVWQPQLRRVRFVLVELMQNTHQRQPTEHQCLLKQVRWGRQILYIQCNISKTMWRIKAAVFPCRRWHLHQRGHACSCSHSGSVPIHVPFKVSEGAYLRISEHWRPFYF